MPVEASIASGTLRLQPAASEAETPAPEACRFVRPTPSASEALNRYHEFVMMVDLLERLPDLAEDIRGWPQRTDVLNFLTPDALRQCRDWQQMSPLAQRAFLAIVAGLDALAGSIASICERGERLPQQDMFAHCRALAFQMRALLERASALLDDAEDLMRGAAQLRADRVFGRT